MLWYFECNWSPYLIRSGNRRRCGFVEVGVAFGGVGLEVYIAQDLFSMTDISLPVAF